MTEAPLDLARRGLIEHYREQEAVEWIKAVGTSMLPAVREGDVLLVDFRARRPRLGQVVLFWGSGQFVSHRVVGHRPDGTLVTKGDNAQRSDPPLRPEEALGVVSAVRRGDDGPLVPARSVAAALLSLGSARGLDLAMRLPRPVRHPLSRPAHALMHAAAVSLSSPRRWRNR
jgi:hypothetical protein